jgi:hypothetical protein
MDGMELYKFRRDTVVRIMEYVNDKADRYGVWMPRFRVLFDEYLADVNHALGRWAGKPAHKGYLYIGYVDMVFKDTLYADGSHIEWKPCQRFSEDALKALLGPDAGEILSYGDVLPYPDDGIYNETPSLDDDLDILALIRVLRDRGFEAARIVAGGKPCVAIYPRRGKADIPGHHYIIFPHKNIWRQVKTSSISEEDLGIIVNREDAYRLLRVYDGIILYDP